MSEILERLPNRLIVWLAWQGMQLLCLQVACPTIHILSLTCRNVHASNTSLLRRNVQIPIDLTIIAIALFQPLVRLLEVTIVKESPVSTERTGVCTLQHQVLAGIDALHSALRRLAPGQEHNTSCTLRSHGIDDLLCELLPTFVCVGVRGVRLDRQACVEQQDAAVGPWREKPTVFGRRSEGRVVPFEALVDVLQGGRSGCRRADGEAETVCLVVVVIGILADDDGFNGLEGSVT